MVLAALMAVAAEAVALGAFLTQPEALVALAVTGQFISLHGDYMAVDPVTAALDIGGKLIDRLWPDPAQRDAAKLELLRLQQSGELAEMTARAEIVKTEAGSEHWLTACWRPITMLTFTTLIVARWFGFAAPELTEAEYLKLWDIVELGLGGYVVGRSAEKIMPSIAEALRK